MPTFPPKTPEPPSPVRPWYESWWVQIVRGTFLLAFLYALYAIFSTHVLGHRQTVRWDSFEIGYVAGYLAHKARWMSC